MFIRQLSYLIALDKHKHFGRAAASCHVSQPALSNAIRELEQELGITIVKRGRTFESLTPEGERVIAWARHMVESLNGLRQEAELIKQLPSGHLVIGVIPTSVHVATILGAAYRKSMPQLSQEILSLRTPTILKRLKNQELDFGLLYDKSLTGDEFDVLPLFSEKYVLVGSPQATPLPYQLSWEDVGKLPLCLLSHDMRNRQMVDDIFKKMKIKPNILLETNALGVLLAEALSGRAFSIMPLSALSTEPRFYNIRIHRITPEHEEDVCLVRLKRKNQPPVSELTWQFAKSFDLQAAVDQSIPKFDNF